MSASLFADLESFRSLAADVQAVAVIVRREEDVVIVGLHECREVGIDQDVRLALAEWLNRKRGL